MKIPEITRKFLSLTVKVFATSLLWTAAAILTKLRLTPNATTWQSTLQQMPTRGLISLLISLPCAWLIIEFLGTTFLELRTRLLEKTAPTLASKIAELPGAAKEVIARWIDRCLAQLEFLRFDGFYRRRIAEEMQHLHTQTGFLYASADFSSTESYTELSLASTQYTEVDGKLLSSKIKGRETIYGFLRSHPPGSTIAILGRPGGGKTTLLRHLALTFASGKQGSHRLRRKIPVILELRRVADLFQEKPGSLWKRPTLVQVVHHYWKQQPSLEGIVQKSPRNWLRRHLAKGNVVVMIDGLDEVPHSQVSETIGGDTPRQKVSKWLEEEVQREEHRKCSFLVTSRPGGFSEAPITQRVSVVEVQPLTASQSERFIHSFHLGYQKKSHPTKTISEIEQAARKQTLKLRQELRDRPHLSDLIVNPLLLHMICLLYSSRGRLPADRSDLYKETCNVLLNRDLRASGMKEVLRPQDKLAALRPLADYFMRSGTPKAKGTGELLSVIEPVFRTLNFNARNFFDYISGDSGILQDVEHEEWDFAHKTFYEYLAAEHWLRCPPTDAELEKWVADDWWRVSLLFYSAKSEDSPVIRAALSNNSPRALSLAFVCLSSNHRLNEKVREVAHSRLNAALTAPRDEQAFCGAAQALLDSRNREVAPSTVEGEPLRRASLVTQAEYQLFLYSIHPDKRNLYYPIHWAGKEFTGDPFSPISGLNQSQVTDFIDWINAKGDSEWTIPPTITRGGYPDGCWSATDRKTRKLRILDKDGSISHSIVRWASRSDLAFPHPGDDWLQLLSARTRLSSNALHRVRYSLYPAHMKLSPSDKEDPKIYGGSIASAVAGALTIGVCWALLYSVSNSPPESPKERGNLFRVVIQDLLEKPDTFTFCAWLGEKQKWLFNVEQEQGEPFRILDAVIAAGFESVLLQCKMLGSFLLSTTEYWSEARKSAEGPWDSMESQLFTEVIERELNLDHRGLPQWQRNRQKFMFYLLKLAESEASGIGVNYHLVNFCTFLTTFDREPRTSIPSYIRTILFGICLLEARSSGVLPPWEKVLLVRAQ